MSEYEEKMMYTKILLDTSFIGLADKIEVIQNKFPNGSLESVVDSKYGVGTYKEKINNNKLVNELYVEHCIGDLVNNQKGATPLSDGKKKVVVDYLNTMDDIYNGINELILKTKKMNVFKRWYTNLVEIPALANKKGNAHVKAMDGLLDTP